MYSLRSIFFKKIQLTILPLLFLLVVNLPTSAYPKDASSVNDANWEPFIQVLNNKIKQNWHPQAKKNYTVEALFYVARDGHISKLELTKKSPDFEFNQSCLKAITLSAPFEAFPPKVSVNDIPVQYTFHYTKANTLPEISKSEPNPILRFWHSISYLLFCLICSIGYHLGQLFHH